MTVAFMQQSAQSNPSTLDQFKGLNLMAKVTGPLMSLEASGTIGNALTFSRWVGRPYVRRYTIPSNPQTLTQETHRNRFSAVGTITTWATRNSQLYDTNTETVQELIKGKTPSDQRWNGYLLRVLTSGNGAQYDAAKAEWKGAMVGNQSAWETAATGLTPPMPSAAQRGALGVSTTAETPGFLLFLLHWAMFQIGVDAAAPGATPPTYA